METIDKADSPLSNLLLDCGRTLRRSSGQDEPTEALMRVADDPLLLRALIFRHGREAPRILPQRQFHGPLGCEHDSERLGGETRSVHPYGQLEPLQVLTFRPEAFVPREEDISQSMLVSSEVEDANPFFGYDRMVVILAGAGVLAFVFLWVVT